MPYLVNVTARAERDLASIFDAINARHADAAPKWYRGLKEAILSLEEQPNRCPETRENVRLRHLLYGNRPHIYRVIYRVTEKPKQVEVLHIRHGARQRFKRSDVKQSLAALSTDVQPDHFKDSSGLQFQRVPRFRLGRPFSPFPFSIRGEGNVARWIFAYFPRNLDSWI